MPVKLTDEQRDALKTAPTGRPVEIHDDQTDRTYLLLAAQDFSAFWHEFMLSEVDRGLGAIDRGEIVEWDPEAIKAKARDSAKNSNR